MRSIVQLFGRSPFVPLQTHMEKVAECVGRLPELFAAYHAKDTTRVSELAKKISKLEYDADQIKHGIRDSLPRGLFLPVDRSNLLTVLSLQDELADRAENLGVLLTFKQAAEFPTFRPLFDKFVAKCLEAVEAAKSIIQELDELLETGFGGAEAEKVRTMVLGVAKLEYEADLLQRELIRELLAHENDLSYGDFFLWTRVIRQLASLADCSDNLAATVRTTIDTR